MCTWGEDGKSSVVAHGEDDEERELEMCGIGDCASFRSIEGCVAQINAVTT
jgi:hypothetical protein